MRMLLPYIRQYKVPVWIALFLMFVELALELVQPMLMAVIIDDGVVVGDLSVVYLWGGILLGLSFLAFLAGIASSFYASEVSQGIGHAVRKDVFEKAQTFSPQHFLKLSTPSLITRITNDVTQLQNIVYVSVRIGLRAPLFIFGGVILAFTVHAGLATIYAIAVPVLLVVLIWVLKKGIGLFERVQSKVDAVNMVLRENLVGMRLIKVFHRAPYEEERFEKVNTDLLDVNKRALWVMEIGLPILMFGMNVAIVLLLWYGAIELQFGTAQPGEIAALVNYGTRILSTFSVFTWLLMALSRAQASAVRIRDVLEEPTDNAKDPSLRTEPIEQGDVEFDKVSFTYPTMKLPALQQVSFRARFGETIGILGETGSGKSSLMQLIPRLYEPTSGHILIDGHETSSLAATALRQRIGFVPQEVQLFTGTVAENVRWGKEDATMEEIHEACRQADIHDFIETLPDKYDTRLGQKGVNFSGGQKQRLSLARALVRKPVILLLDDSTSALDAETEAHILKTLRQQNCTVFVVAQKISSVREADRILLLKDGKCIAQGTHNELLAANPFYQDIVRSQSKEEVVSGG
ncbi:ABC transporter ATP-binding protein [Bacillus fonticola]|uniref:ABC transporter ATP-binding protein n=1 Tax=Bacillus fonticola TaxID=2728853 RepID=UPI001473E3E7|nr:ABC transporter ATP-binding protein [Bacillus fonticola]